MLRSAMLWRAVWLGFVLLQGQHALAQGPVTRPDESMETIIITGQRRPVDEPKLSDIDLSQIPSAILAIDSLNQHLGVNIQPGSGAESLSAIRSPVLTGGAGAGSFFYGLNAISLRATGFGNVNGFLDMPFDAADRIELYKGPSSILLGPNAHHGGINAVFDTQIQDGFHHSEKGRLKLTLGSENYLSLQGKYSADSVFKAAMTLTHDGGFRANSGYDSQKLLMAHKVDLGMWTANSFAALTNLNQETAGFVRGAEAYRDEGLSRDNDFPESFRDLSSALAAINVSRPIMENERAAHTLSVTPYSRFNEMSFLLHFLPGQALEQSDHYSLGVKTSLAGGALDRSFLYELGAEIEHTQAHLDEVQSEPTMFSFTQGVHYNFDVSAKRKAAFADISAQISTVLTAQLGARAERLEYDYDNLTQEGAIGRFLRPADRVDRFNYLMADAGLYADFTPSFRAYAKVVKTARPPQASDLYRVQINQAEGRAATESLQGLEAGFQMRFAGGSRLSMALYDWDKDNYFFRDADGFNVTDGSTSHKAIEIDARIKLTDHISLTSGTTLESHKYEFSRNVTNLSEVISAGSVIDTAPEITAYTRLNFDYEVFDIQLGWSHMGSYFTNASNTQKYPGHNVFDVNLRYSQNWGKISLHIDNLFDQAFADRADFAFGTERYFPARPRSIYVSIERQFR